MSFCKRENIYTVLGLLLLWEHISDIVKLPSDIKPVFEIPKMKPLGVYPYQPALYTSQTPKNTIYNADIPSDYRHWDCIVVSKRYIDELVEHNLTKNLPIDFLDRLYIVDSVKENNETVGVKRFQKAFDPKSPAEYVNDLSNNLHPSLCSIQNLLDAFNLYPRSLKDRINMLALTNKLPMYIEQRKIEACNLHNN